VALSMSGPLTRMSDDVIDRGVPILRQAADRIGVELAAPTPAAV
jgi:DNA-binding IclR family transcriptional regulator